MNSRPVNTSDTRQRLATEAGTLWNQQGPSFRIGHSRRVRRTFTIGVVIGRLDVVIPAASKSGVDPGDLRLELRVQAIASVDHDFLLGGRTRCVAALAVQVTEKNSPALR
jgi:hypothetical protein